MKLTIIGRNISVTDGLRNMVEKKLGKLDKFFRQDTASRVCHLILLN